MADTNIKRNDEYLLQKLREHAGWAEVKVKNGHIIEVNLKISIKK